MRPLPNYHHLPAASNVKVPAPLTAAVKSVFERAADIARRNLISLGNIVPAVFFSYENGTMKTASLSFTNELQKEAQMRRIKEKALAERASGVLMLTGTERGEKGSATLTWATPGEQVSACLDYGFEGEDENCYFMEDEFSGRARSE